VVKRLVILTFNEESVAQPIIHNLGQQFNIATNIRRAAIGESGGMMEVEIEGKEIDIDAGLTWAISLGVRVESLGDENPL